MKNFKTIITKLQKSELSLIDSRKADFQAYISEVEMIKKATKIELKSISEGIVKGTSLKIGSIEDKFRLIKKALKLGLDLAKYNSFRGLKSANSLASSKVGKVLQSGVNKGTAKIEPKKAKIEKSKNEVKIQAKNDGIEMIKKDAKFIAFLEYAKTQNFDLNLLRLAIK